jgi:hypothetical protein
VASSWKGAFLGTNFTFGSTQTRSGQTGRYHSEESGEWDDLLNFGFTLRHLALQFSVEAVVDRHVRD